MNPTPDWTSDSRRDLARRRAVSGIQAEVVAGRLARRMAAIRLEALRLPDAAIARIIEQAEDVGRERGADRCT